MTYARDFGLSVGSHPYSSELRETALAHTIGNKAEAAYRHALEKRRAMMEAWAAWCEPKNANVVAFASRAERTSGRETTNRLAPKG
jgi:hypothetical protein